VFDGRTRPTSSQLIKQRLGFFQVRRIETLGEPSMDRGEKIMGLLSFALITPQPGDAERNSHDFACCSRATASARSK
jgi:hypothetical protein